MTRKISFLLSLMLVVLLSVLSVLYLDRPVALWVERNPHDAWESFLLVVTNLGRAEIWFGVAALFLISGFRWKSRARQLRRAGDQTDGASSLEEKSAAAYRVGFFLLACLIAAGLAVNVLKLVSGRYRPPYLLTENVYGFRPFALNFVWNSFPSGHAQVICTAMTALGLLYPRHIVAFGFVAVLISVSRVLLNVHFVSDVIMGAYLGIVTTVWIHFLFRRKGYL